MVTASRSSDHPSQSSQEDEVDQDDDNESQVSGSDNIPEKKLKHRSKSNKKDKKRKKKHKSKKDKKKSARYETILVILKACLTESVELPNKPGQKKDKKSRRGVTRRRKVSLSVGKRGRGRPPR